MTRRQGWLLLLCFVSGCSTHPIADLCDYFKPGKMGPNLVQPYGGVAIPQGPIVPPAPNFPGGPIIPVPGGVIPPPATLPGNRPPGGILLQPPGADIPLPPTPPRPGG
jgi:hypothetical protein